MNDIARTGGVDIIKINAQEAYTLTQLDASAFTIQQVAQCFFSHYAIPILAITNGPLCAHLFTQDKDIMIWSEFTIPSFKLIGIYLFTLKIPCHVK